MDTTQTYKIGDCLELMESVSDKSVDLIIADPPYSVGMSSNGRRSTQYEGYFLEPYFREFIKVCKRVLKNTGSLYMFCDWRTYPILFKAFTPFITVQNLIVWDYGWIKAGQHYRYTHEFILYATMPETSSIPNRSKSDVWRMKPINFTAERFDAAEKPLEVIEEIIYNSSKEGDLILDPYTGSGTVLLAARRTNRNCIAFEVNPDKEDTIKKRLMVNIPSLEAWAKYEKGGVESIANV